MATSIEAIDSFLVNTYLPVIKERHFPKANVYWSQLDGQIFQQLPNADFWEAQLTWTNGRRLVYGRIRIAALLLSQDQGAFARALDREILALVNDMKREIARQTSWRRWVPLAVANRVYDLAHLLRGY